MEEQFGGHLQNFVAFNNFVQGTGLKTAICQAIVEKSEEDGAVSAEA